MPTVAMEVSDENTYKRQRVSPSRDVIGNGYNERSTSDDDKGFMKMPARNYVAETYSYSYEEGKDDNMEKGDHGAIEEHLAFQDSSYKDAAFIHLNTLRKHRELCDVVFYLGNREIAAHKVVLAAASPTLYDLFVQDVRNTSTNTPVSGSGSGSAVPAQTSTSYTSSPNAEARNGPTGSSTNVGGGPSDWTPIRTPNLPPTCTEDEQDVAGIGTPGRLAASAEEAGKKETAVSYFKFPELDPDAFEALVNYAYTACLEASPQQVKNLYKVAYWLKMKPCAKACARYLARQLTPANCIGIRKYANGTNDMLLAAQVDDYILQNFGGVHTKSKEFTSLPCIQIEIVLGFENDDTKIGQLWNEMLRNDLKLGDMVLDYLEGVTGALNEQAKFRMDDLVDKVQMLYVNEDMTLHDCKDTSDISGIGISDHVRDYKRRTSRQNVSIVTAAAQKAGVKGTRASPTPKEQMHSFASCDSLASSSCDEIDWRTIAVSKVSDTYYIVLAVINRQLSRMSIHVNRQVAAQRNNNQCPEHHNHLELSQSADRTISCSGTSRSSTGSMGKLLSCSSGTGDDGESSLELLSTMATPRCAVGAAHLNEKLVVTGGYDRGECLKSTEMYDPCSNTWTELASLVTPRGRVDAAVCNNEIYAIGGSNGTHELDSGEKYNATSDTWTKIASLPSPRSQNGCCCLNDEIYCIGGWNGQIALKDSYKYDPSNDSWNSIAPLDQGRYQAACITWINHIIVIGGCDTWNCVNSVNLYNPLSDSWSKLPPMSTPRRGCGAAVLDGKIYVIGGSDGNQALASIEIYDVASQTWHFGPVMTVPRANVRAVALDGKVWAVGGFSGKSFLNTIEYLDPKSGVWKDYAEPGKSPNQPIGGDRQYSPSRSSPFPEMETCSEVSAPPGDDTIFETEELS